MCESSGCGPNDTSGQASHSTSQPLSSEQKRAAFIFLYFLKRGGKTAGDNFSQSFEFALFKAPLLSWNIQLIISLYPRFMTHPCVNQVVLFTTRLFFSTSVYICKDEKAQCSYSVFLEELFVPQKAPHLTRMNDLALQKIPGYSKDNQLLSGRTGALPVVIDIRCTHFLNSLKFVVLNVKLWQAGCGPRVSSL